MKASIGVDAALCIRCGRCVTICPATIFEQSEPRGAVSLHKPENCIGCGHCVAACPPAAIGHTLFPAERVHPIDSKALPTAEQVLALCQMRRSMRAFTSTPIPSERLEQIIAAADTAPTATNARLLEYTLVTDPARLRAVSEFTLDTFGRVVRLLSNPFVRVWLRPLKPDLYRYVPVFKRMESEYAQGVDRILRGATALLVIHSESQSRFCAEDANLAYQNASLMAEALGVGQFYGGFVLTASRQRRGQLERLLGIEGRRVGAVMALGMPQFRYLRYIDREPAPVTQIG